MLVKILNRSYLEVYEKNRLDAFNNQKKRLNSKKNITLKPNDRSKPGYLYRLKSEAKKLRLNFNNLSFNVSIFL